MAMSNLIGADFIVVETIAYDSSEPSPMSIRALDGAAGCECTVGAER